MFLSASASLLLAGTVSVCIQKVSGEKHAPFPASDPPTHAAEGKQC